MIGCVSPVSGGVLHVLGRDPAREGSRMRLVGELTELVTRQVKLYVANLRRSRHPEGDRLGDSRPSPRRAAGRPPAHGRRTRCPRGRTHDAHRPVELAEYTSLEFRTVSVKLDTDSRWDVSALVTTTPPRKAGSPRARRSELDAVTGICRPMGRAESACAEAENSCLNRCCHQHVRTIAQQPVLSGFVDSRPPPLGHAAVARPHPGSSAGGLTDGAPRRSGSAADLYPRGRRRAAAPCRLRQGGGAEQRVHRSVT